MKTNVKKKIVSCRDPKTGHWGRQEVEQTTYRYDDQEKISIVNEFLHENRDAQAIVDKYHISSVMTLYSWVGRVMIQTETLSLQEQTEDDMARKSKDDQIRELKAQLKQARKEAELEKLRAHAYDTMINLAEETFNIPIRKKIWHQTVSLLREESPAPALKTLCGLFGYSRQSFYNRIDDNDFAENAIEPLIVEKAKDYRKDNPGLGCAKLYIIIKRLFESTGCMPGRDAFIELLRTNGLMVQIKRRRHYKTTDSNHQYRKYDNLAKEIVPMRPNEVWVSDITYVETDEGVCYLSLITDAYSHKIVGWAIGPTLETVYPLQALRMALETIDDDTASRLIHHSDRGCQYCSAAYVAELKKHNIMISMTQSGDPLENAIAERANGILKTEWLYKMKIPTIEKCKEEMKRIILFYNTERPHMSIGNKTPEVVHGEVGEQKRCWRNAWEKAAESAASG